MKTKTGRLAPNEEYKKVMIKELEFVIQKLDQSPGLDEKIYYFSAVQGLLNRIMNFEFTEDLLFAWFVTNETQKSFQLRLAGLKQGDAAAKFTEQQITRLSEITKELLEQVINDRNAETVLKKYILLCYSLTGNGYYLMEKGVLKI